MNIIQPTFPHHHDLFFCPKPYGLFGRLRVTYINGRHWAIWNPTTYADGSSNHQQFGYQLPNGKSFTIPHRFITDFASIPRFFWRIAPPVGSGAHAAYGYQAIPHDYLYRTKHIAGVPITRTQADDIFDAIGRQTEIMPMKRRLMHRSLRLFGRRAWRNAGRTPFTIQTKLMCPAP